MYWTVAIVTWFLYIVELGGSLQVPEKNISLLFLLVCRFNNTSLRIIVCSAKGRDCKQVLTRNSLLEGGGLNPEAINNLLDFKI
jgi:hypothetical protein